MFLNDKVHNFNTKYNYQMARSSRRSLCVESATICCKKQYNILVVLLSNGRRYVHEEDNRSNHNRNPSQVHNRMIHQNGLQRASSARDRSGLAHPRQV